MAGSPYAITAALGSLAAGNYTFGFVNGELSVTQKALSVNAANKTKTYGQADPTPTWTFSGFVGTDTAASAGITGTASCNIASHSENAGTYADVITCVPGTLTSANYSFQTGSRAT